MPGLVSKSTSPGQNHDIRTFVCWMGTPIKNPITRRRLAESYGEIPIQVPRRRSTAVVQLAADYQGIAFDYGFNIPKPNVGTLVQHHQLDHLGARLRLPVRLSPLQSHNMPLLTINENLGNHSEGDKQVEEVPGKELCALGQVRPEDSHEQQGEKDPDGRNTNPLKVTKRTAAVITIFGLVSILVGLVCFGHFFDLYLDSSERNALCVLVWIAFLVCFIPLVTSPKAHGSGLSQETEFGRSYFAKTLVGNRSGAIGLKTALYPQSVLFAGRFRGSEPLTSVCSWSNQSNRSGMLVSGYGDVRHFGVNSGEACNLNIVRRSIPCILNSQHENHHLLSGCDFFNYIHVGCGDANVCPLGIFGLIFHRIQRLEHGLLLMLHGDKLPLHHVSLFLHSISRSKHRLTLNSQIFALDNIPSLSLREFGIHSFKLLAHNFPLMFHKSTLRPIDTGLNSSDQQQGERERALSGEFDPLANVGERGTSPHNPSKPSNADNSQAASNQGGEPAARPVDLRRLRVGVSMAALCFVIACGCLFYLLVIHNRNCNTKTLDKK